ncbi:hypothetical protein [Saccharopolyspora sp. NPDC002376]
MIIEDIEFDDLNLPHLARHGVHVAEVIAAFENALVFRHNRSGRTADRYVLGRSNGGRTVRVNFIYDAARRSARPISASEVPPCRSTPKK